MRSWQLTNADPRVLHLNGCYMLLYDAVLHYILYYTKLYYTVLYTTRLYELREAVLVRPRAWTTGVHETLAHATLSKYSEDCRGRSETTHNVGPLCCSSGL